MKSIDIYKAFGEIDEKYISEAVDTAEKIRASSHARIMRACTLAACIALVVAAIPVALHYGYTFAAEAGIIRPSDGPAKNPDTDDTGTAAPDTIEPIKDDFDIRNGVMFGYTGEETEVTVPDDVKYIVADAFKSAPHVKKLTIGSNTEYVEPELFDNMPNLSSVEVSPENEYYHIDYIDGKLVRNGRAFTYDSIGAYPGYMADSMLYQVVDIMEASNFRTNHFESIFVGSSEKKGEIKTEIEYERSGDDGTYISRNIVLRSVTSCGQTINIENEALKYGLATNRKFQAFETDDCFVVAVDTDMYVTSLIITDDSAVYVDSKEEGNGCRIAFFCEDGVLKYERIPEKFTTNLHQIFGGVFIECAAKDELFRETGRAVIENGAVRYIREEYVTVEEAFDLEKEFSVWREIMQLSPDMTLEEWLAKNSLEFDKIT